MISVLSWVAFPLAMLLVAVGAGLLAERIARVELPAGLLAPVGACVCVLLALPVYLFDGTAPVAAVVLVVAAVAGLLLGRRDLRRPDWAAPALAGLATYVLFMAPVLLSGHWTWTGYNFVNDTSVNMIMVDHIAHYGDVAVSKPVTSADSLVNGTLGTAYPLGIHALLASLNWLVPLPLPAVYQPFIATLGLLAAMSFTELARRCGLPKVVAVVAAVTAMGANLTYQYALHGAFKEIALVMVLATAAALARMALDARLPFGVVALMAVSLAAAIAVISSAAAAYALVLGGVVFAAALWLEPARLSLPVVGRAALVGAGVLLVAVAPFLRQALVFAQEAGAQYSNSATLGGQGSTNVFGHLLRELPPYQGLGIWLRDDYRYPLEPGLERNLTSVAMVIVGLLVVVAVVAEVRRRRLGATLALVPAVLVYVVATPRLSPYAEAKLLVAAAPMAMFAAAVGAWWLWTRFRPAGVLAAAVLTLGVGASNALAYHHVRLAPTERMESLEDVAERARGGPWLSTEWEEFAKYYGRKTLNVAPESFSPLPADLREPGPIFSRSIDLDDVRLEYVQRWRGVIIRRGPLASRPPANFSPSYQNAHYEMWRRNPNPRVLEHLPLTSRETQTRVPFCADVTAMAGRARAGERLVAAPVPRMPALDPRYLPLRPNSWGVGPLPDVVITEGQGRVVQTLRFAAGRYRVWVRASQGRPLTVSLDGRRVGSVGEINTPGQWLEVGTVSATAGPHRVTLFRGGGTLAPGNGFDGDVGRVVFEPVERPRLVSVAPEDASRLCRRPWDWIERVRP